MDTTNLFHSNAIHIDKKTIDLVPKRTLIPSNQHSLETLLSIQDQNNEKLKVTLRRLSIYENEIQELKKKAEDFHHEKSNLSDQIFVLRDKDKASRQAIEALHEQIEVLEVKNTLLNEKVYTQTLEINRLQKYQEKIKNEVKPYFAQLKEYSKSLEEQHKRAVANLEQKELTLRELRLQMDELIKNYQTQIESDNMKISKITDSYESEIFLLKKEINDLTSKFEVSEKACSQNQEYYNRFLNSENHKIELQRSLENKTQELIQLTESFKTQETELRKFNFKHESENKDLRITLNILNSENQELTQKNLDIEQQLESMKFLWNQKNKETDRLKAALESLENINLELSKQLNAKG